MLERRRLVAQTTHLASPQQATQTTTLSPHARAQRRLRRPQELLDAVTSVDLATDEATRKQLLDWIRQVYEERGGGQLVGLFSKCYLGEPFVDHQLSLDGTIAEHYKRTDDVPAVFVPCRGLARSDAYVYIEVYGDGQVVPIRADGNPAI